MTPTSDAIHHPRGYLYMPLVWGCHCFIRGEVPPRPELRIKQDTILTPFLCPNINAKEEDPEAMELPMNDKVMKEIENFMFNLGTVADLHHPNDERRLYNIALEAVRANQPVPRDEMRIAFEKAVEEQKLNPDCFEVFYSKYIQVLERAHDIISRIHRESPIQDSFRF